MHNSLCTRPSKSSFPWAHSRHSEVRCSCSAASSGRANPKKCQPVHKYLQEHHTILPLHWALANPVKPSQKYQLQTIK